MQTTLQLLSNERVALYSTSSILRSDDTGRIFIFVKKEGDPDSTPVSVDRRDYIAKVTDVIMAKLKISGSPTHVVLHKLQQGESLTPLDSKMTVEEAEVEEKDEVIVKVTASPDAIDGQFYGPLLSVRCRFRYLVTRTSVFTSDTNSRTQQHALYKIFASRSRCCVKK
jgi:hypothetical protein